MARARDMSAAVADRLARLRSVLAKLELDGYLIAERKDQYWLTGFTGESGYVLVTPRQVVLLTDGRFTETARREAPWARAIIRRKRGLEETARLLKPYRLERLGYDPADVSVQVFGAFRKVLTGVKLVSASNLIDELRLVKDAEELSAIRRAIDVAQRAFQRATAKLKPTMTERELAARIEYEMGVLGASEPAFPTNVSAGETACLPHYSPSAGRELGRQPVLIDWGARVDWYVSDLTRVLPGASIPPRLKNVYETVRTAHDAAIAAVQPGQTAGSVDRAARRAIERAGFGKAFTHGTGHGLGLDVHENPRVGRGSETVLQPGMVFTIEPGVYIPGAGGVRIESDVLVTSTGCEVLTDLPY